MTEWEDLGQVVPDMEYIDIQASNYNPNIDDTITITVTVTDQDDNPITNKSYALKENGETLTTLTTNNSGVATYTYTCDDIGIRRFSIKSYTTYVNVVESRLIIQSIYVELSSIAANGTTSTTTTVRACPNGYSPYFAISTIGWHNISGWSLNGTTLTISTLNASTSQHSAVARGILIYYKDGAF